MVSFARRLRDLLPTVPKKRYNIFAGTNTSEEWWQMFRTWLLGGPHEEEQLIREYERRFAARCGSRHGVSFGAGRMALYAILEALDIGRGDEVIIPAFTCVVVPNAILYRGARPVYVDIEARTFNIDPDQVECAITPRTKALYAQHTFGVPCEVDALLGIAKRHSLPVIEDAAHAFGASYDGRPAGSLTDVAFFSSDHSKVVNTHLGGMAVTRDDALATRLREVQSAAPDLNRRAVRRLIRSFLLEYVLFAPPTLWLGRTIHTLLARAGLLFFFDDELATSKPTDYPYPCRLSSAQARLGLSQLQALEGNLAHRRRIAEWLEKQVGWYGLSSSEVNELTWLRYSFLVRDRAAFESEFANRFDLGVWFTSVVNGRTTDLEAVAYQRGDCPIAEYVAEHIVNFPTHPRIPLQVIRDEVGLKWSRIEPQILFDSSAFTDQPTV